MKHRSPFYSLLHSEIHACADHLLEISQFSDDTPELNADAIIGKLYELQQFAEKIRPEERYLPLTEYNAYLENTMVKYQDDLHSLQTIRLSEAVSLLGLGSQSEYEFKPSIVRSLTKQLMRHFNQDIKPGRPLFRKLVEIKKI
jgi:hypothetical protein